MHTTPVCRCPRCAYSLTGLPGAPEDATPYGAFTAAVRCPECALEIPTGAHCLVGGASPDVVDPSGSRSVVAIAVGAALLVGGPWIAILSSVVLVEMVRNASLKRGIPLSSFQGWAIGALPVAAAIGVVAWLLWRRWRAAEAGSGDRAGARLRRAMVVPGGLHLWTGEPAADAKPRSLAGGDIRDVRGRRHVPLFRKKGAGEAGAVDFVTPIVLWNANDAKMASNLRDGRWAGTIWLLMQPGTRPEPVAAALERTLRSEPAMPPVRVDAARLGSVETPTVDGDPNRLAVPVAITAGTAAEPATCPRCSHPLANVPDGAWWDPLPAAVTCPECGLQAPAGAVVISGFRHPGEAQRRETRGRVLALAFAVIAALLVAGGVVLLASRISPIWGVAIQAIAFAGLVAGGAKGVRMSMRPIARPRARFQRSTETWIAEPGRLRIVVRGRPDAAVAAIPARGISRVTFGQPLAGAEDNSIPVQTDTLTVRGTAQELGLAGERHLHVPLPAEVDDDAVVQALRGALSSGG